MNALKPEVNVLERMEYIILLEEVHDAMSRALAARVAATSGDRTLRLRESSW